jgi:hypothetical protein
MLRDLGTWLRCHLKKGIQEQGETAQKVLDSCEILVADLWSQWTEQWAAQLFICTHKLFLSFVFCCSHISDAPARLKKELDSVLI